MALGIAEGLQYLHHDCPRRIIHRDIKASNILLNANFEAQVHFQFSMYFNSISIFSCREWFGLFLRFLILDWQSGFQKTGFTILSSLSKAHSGEAFATTPVIYCQHSDPFHKLSLIYIHIFCLFKLENEISDTWLLNTLCMGLLMRRPMYLLMEFCYLRS